MHSPISPEAQVEKWPDPIPLAPSLLPVPAFKPAFLPPKLRAWAGDIADRNSVPLDFAGIPAIVQAGSLIGRKVGLKPEKFIDWIAPANLWGCIIAPAGFMKTPTIAEVLKPLSALEAQAHKANAAALFQHEVECETARKGTDGGKAMPPDKPKLKRHIVNNSTVEALGVILSDNPNGVLVHSDELLTLFAKLQRADAETERGFYLSGWSGDQGYSFDRITRGQTRIEAVTLSLLGSTQPSIMRRFVREGIASYDDGMTQRLQLAVWPDFSGKWKPCEHYANTAHRVTAWECLHGLADLSPEAVGAVHGKFDDGSGIPYLSFSEDAQTMWNDWRLDLENRIQRPDDLTPAIVSHLSKFRGLVARLALIYHLCGDGAGDVSLDAICNAIDFAAHLESHAMRIYHAAQNSGIDAAGLLLSRIKRGHLADGFTARKIKQRDWSGLNNSAIVDEAIETLIDHNCLIEMPIVQTGGKPLVTYQINPNALR